MARMIVKRGVSTSPVRNPKPTGDVTKILSDMRKILEDAEEAAEKLEEGKKKYAAIVRKHMQELKNLAVDTRKVALEFKESL